MLIALLIWLLRKKTGSMNTRVTFKKLLINSSFLNKPVTFLVLFSLLWLSTMAQQQVYNYQIIYKKSIIGQMQYIQQQSGNNLYLKIVSNAETKMLMTIKINVQEEAHYANNKLVYSHIYRYVNGKQKINKKTTAAGNVYQTSSDGKNGSIISQPIDCNFTLLYSREPVNISQVYSDAFQQFVVIKTLEPHVYKVELPDGNNNVYYYKNGICIKVAVHNTWGNVQMQLAQNSIL